MAVEFISDTVEKVKKKYDETDPVRLCNAMKIKLNYYPLGTKDGCCKGFYMEKSRIQVITINSDLPKIIQKIILAHEIGHAVLHKDSAGIKAFHEFDLFDDTSKMEYEANLFAAEFLLDDQDVFDTLNKDVSFFGAARVLYVPPELLDFKFRVMKRKGYQLQSPILSHGDFLKDLEIPTRTQILY